MEGCLLSYYAAHHPDGATLSDSSKAVIQELKCLSKESRPTRSRSTTRNKSSSVAKILVSLTIKLIPLATVELSFKMS